MRLAILGAGAMFLAGCATKDYPDIPVLTEFEAENMTCADLAAEMQRTEELRREVVAESNPDIDTVTGALLDFGIRNAMALDDANEQLRDRQVSIRRAWTSRGC